MQYPPILPGQQPDDTDLAAMRAVYTYKATATSRASTTTATDDPDLIFTLAANAKYIVEFYLFYGGTGKIRTAWRVPSGATGVRSVFGPGSSATDTSADNINMRSGVFSYTATSLIYGTRGSTNLLVAIEKSLVTTTTSGTCALQWAQGTSDVNATSMGSGAWGRATRVA